MIIDGEEMSESRMQFYRDVLKNDAIRIAGEFHNMERSKKFRTRWPNEYDYAEANWKNFVAAARALYARQLGNAHTSPENAEIMHRALVIDAMTNHLAAVATGEEDNSLQLGPNSQQFAGDRKENAHIEETYGIGAGSFRDILLRTASRFHKH